MKRTMIQTQLANAHAFSGHVRLDAHAASEPVVCRPRVASAHAEGAGDLATP